MISTGYCKDKNELFVHLSIYNCELVTISGKILCNNNLKIFDLAQLVALATEPELFIQRNFFCVDTLLEKFKCKSNR